MQLSEFQVNRCKLEYLQRLCKYLKIDPSSDMKRESLVSWLQYQGFVRCEWPAWRMY